MLSKVAMGAASVSCLLGPPHPPGIISFILGNEVIDVRDLVGELAEVPLPNKILDDSCILPLFLVPLPGDTSEEFITGAGG